MTRVCEVAMDCPLGHYGDPFTKLCVTNCPYTQETYALDSTKKCVNNCPVGTFADNSTYKCVPQCPSTPSYYGFQ